MYKRQTLARSTPLIFTSLCACFAYRCGVFNLGGEGQFLMGSIVCCYIATQSGIEGLPAIILCLAGGAAAGGVWSLISGLLKVYRGQNEMIITIMLNYVATLFMGVVYTLSLIHISTACRTAPCSRRPPPWRCSRCLLYTSLRLAMRLKSRGMLCLRIRPAPSWPQPPA